MTDHDAPTSLDRRMASGLTEHTMVPAHYVAELLRAAYLAGCDCVPWIETEAHLWIDEHGMDAGAVP